MSQFFWVITLNAERIRNLREDADLTQEDFSIILGCKRSTYSLWELNKNTIPLYYLNEVSNYFGISTDYLTYLSDDKLINSRKTKINRVELGRRIRQARKSVKYTQVMLAEKLNTTHSVISAYESGKTSVPTLFMIEIARITKRTLDWFLGKE